MRRRFADAVRTRTRPPQARPEDPDLRRRADSSTRHAARSERGAGRLRSSAEPLRRRPGRRVPGHGPRAVGDHARRLRRPGFDARADRRPQAGDLCVPRRGRGRVPRRQSRRRRAVDARRELAQRRAAPPRPTTRCSPNARLGHPDIAYRHIKAAASERGPAARRGTRQRPAPRADRAQERRPRRHRCAGALGDRARARRDCGGPGRAKRWTLLRAKPTIIKRHRDGSEAGTEELGAGHIAVLVRSNKEAFIVRDALHEVGVPAVIGGAGSVFLAEPAREWLRLFEALERPTSRDRASLAALTRFVGWSAVQLATRDRGRMGGPALGPPPVGRSAPRQGRGHVVRDRVQRTGRSGTGPGPGERRPVHDRSAARRPTAARGSGQRGRRRDGHGQSGWGAASTSPSGPQRARTGPDGSNRTRPPCRSSRSTGVRAWSSPSSCAPTLWDGYIHPVDVPVYHDPDHGNKRTIDVGQQRPGTEAAQAVGGVRGAGRGPPAAVCRADPGPTPSGAVVGRRLVHRQLPAVAPPVRPRRRRHRGPERRARSPDRTPRSRRPSLRWARRCRSSVSLGLRGPAGKAEAGVPRHRPGGRPRFARSLDAGWRRLSYSSITQPVHEQPAIASEPEQPLIVGRGSRFRRCGAPAPGRRTTRYGNVALELGPCQEAPWSGRCCTACWSDIEFDAPDLEEEVRGALATELTWRNVDLGDTEAVVAGLCARRSSLPLGPDVGGVRLRDVPRRHRLDELGFELPLVGGDRPSGSPGRLATSPRSSRNTCRPTTPCGALRRTAARPGPEPRRSAATSTAVSTLSSASTTAVRAGRLQDEQAGRRQTRCSLRGTTARRPCRPKMLQAHYPLQALLYSVALHRYLRWRLPGYDPRRQPRRRPLPLPARHERSRARARGRPSLRRVVVASAVRLVEALSDLFDRGVRP